MNFDILNGAFNKSNVNEMNSLVLAYIGDAVFEVFIRGYLVKENKNIVVQKLHKKGIAYVKAKAQSDYVKRIMDQLSEEEIRVFKRGRNAKSGTVPKNADIQDYRNATGLEALIGYLYVTENYERLNRILEMAIEADKDTK
ncbi:MAG: Mini-ribonuclease 3 [Clostridiaceae bacterium]